MIDSLLPSIRNFTSCCTVYGCTDRFSWIIVCRDSIITVHLIETVIKFVCIVSDSGPFQDPWVGNNSTEFKWLLLIKNTSTAYLSGSKLRIWRRSIVVARDNATYAARQGLEFKHLFSAKHIPWPFSNVRLRSTLSLSNVCPCDLCTLSA